MTARIDKGHVVEISSEAGENAEEVRQAYLAELRSRGHDMYAVADRKLVEDDQVYACRGCKFTVRSYMVDRKCSMFSDFNEGDQCHWRQANIMSLLQ